MRVKVFVPKDEDSTGSDGAPVRSPERSRVPEVEQARGRRGNPPTIAIM